MANLESKIRHVQSLLNVTTARGATPGEADNAQRLARQLIDRHGLQEMFARKPAERPRQDVDPVRAAAERFWEAMRASGASEEAIQRERAKWERDRTAKARRPSEEAYERAKDEWQQAKAEWDTARDGPNPRQDYAGYRRHAAQQGWKTRRQRKKENRLKEYKGANGTARAVEAIGRGKAVNEKQLAEWYGGLSVDAAHGRLWRAAMAGLLKKVKGGYVVA